MTDIAPPVVGQEPWGDDLNAYLAYLDGRITAGSGTGSAGGPGPEGPQGPAGIQGEQGPQGPQGEPGPQGEDGPQGVPGADGLVGAQGPQGDPGVDGAAGVPGTTGPEGAVGPQGQQGELGPEGPQGVQGTSVGAASFQWLDANTISDPGHGVVKCNASTPRDSTVWCVSKYDKTGALVRFTRAAVGVTWIIYESEKYSTWDRYEVTDTPVDMGEWLQVPAVFVVTGPQAFSPGNNDIVMIESEAGMQEGPPGPTGPQGPQGLLGPEGPAGAQGVPGTPGTPGQDGPQGIPGVAGPQGLAGAQGVQGAPGAKGDQGDVGPSGPQGSTGAQGVQGAAGVKGDKGDKGDTGATGPEGTIISSMSTARVTVANTAAESLLISVPLPVITPGMVFSLDMWGDILSTAANYTYTFRLRQGSVAGALLFDMAPMTINASTSPRNWSSRVILIGVAAPLADVTMTLGIGAASAATRLSAPTLVNGVSPNVPGFTAATSLSLTVQISTAVATSNARLLGYFLRKIG